MEREAAADSANKIRISSGGHSRPRREERRWCKCGLEQQLHRSREQCQWGALTAASGMESLPPLLGYQRFQRSSKLASNVWGAARIGDGVIERDGERGDFCWLQGTRKLGVTPRKRILPINCQSNLATQKILLFVVTTRLRLSIRLFLPCYRPFSASDNLLPRFLLFFFILNEGGEREFGDSRILRGKVSSVPWRGREILFSWEKWSDFGE